MFNCFISGKAIFSNAPLNFCHISRRYRYKKKWAVNLKKDTNQQLALGNFDAFYKPYFGNKWPSIRLSLQSLPKHCAVINKYGDESKIKNELKTSNLINFIEKACLLQEKNISEGTDDPSPQIIQETTHDNASEVDLESDAAECSISNHEADGAAIINYDQLSYEDNLNVFVPTEQVYTEKERLLKEEITFNTFQPDDVGIKVVTPDTISIPKTVKALIYPPGNVSSFPHPKPNSGIFGYYLMDAASVLPVIALDVQPLDQVFDICAAPGGKSFVILQSLDLLKGGTLACNDSSQSRVSRLKNILFSHFPTDVAKLVNVTKKDGTQIYPTEFNKVLVDVPCNGDRYAVTEEDNNLFHISRTGERLNLMKTQRQLLKSAIKSCLVGGTIVYSTCTLSPAQNDGVIQAVIEDLWQSSSIEVVVIDLTPLTDLFSQSHTFRFHKDTKYGKLVLPNLLNNFGPTYFAKLKRIK